MRIIQIDKRKKAILFQKEFSIGDSPLKTVECKLIAGYICPHCKEILLAYFRTDEFIHVWRYDEKVEKDKNYDCEKERRHYRYRVFYAGCGIMGMELTEHNSEHREHSCIYEVRQSYNIIESINEILKGVYEKLQDKAETKRDKSAIKLRQIPDDFDKKELIENLGKAEGITLIPDVCRGMDPLIHFDIRKIGYKEIDTYEFDYGSKEYKRAERQNFENMKKAYDAFIARIMAC